MQLADYGMCVCTYSCVCVRLGESSPEDGARGRCLSSYSRVAFSEEQLCVFDASGAAEVHSQLHKYTHPGTNAQLHSAHIPEFPVLCTFNEEEEVPGGRKTARVCASSPSVTP